MLCFFCFAGSNLTCRVNSTALDTPLYRSIHIDMDIVPDRLEMHKDAKAELKEGDKVTVTCVASGAKPEVQLNPTTRFLLYNLLSSPTPFGTYLINRSTINRMYRSGS